MREPPESPPKQINGSPPACIVSEHCVTLQPALALRIVEAIGGSDALDSGLYPDLEVFCGLVEAQFIEESG